MNTSRPQFHNFQLFNAANWMQIESKEGSDFVEAVHPSSTGVHVQPAPRGIPFDPQEMAVPTNEHIGAFLGQHGPDPGRVSPRPATDVQHDDPILPEDPILHQRVLGTHAVIIDVAEDGADGGGLAQGIDHLQPADVPGMPNLIHARHVVQNPLIHVPVGVRNQPHPNSFALHVRKVGRTPFICHMIPVFRPLFLFVCFMFADAVVAQRPMSTEDRKALKAYEAALAAYMAQDLASAEASLLQALNRDDDFVEAWLMLGQILEDLHRPSDAADALREGLERKPRSFLRGHADLIGLLHAAGRYDEALEALENAERNEYLLAVRWEDGGLAAYHRTRASVRFAAAAVDSPVDVQPRPVPGDIHTDASEYGPATTLNGLTLLFTREGRAEEGHFQEDFYVSTRKHVDEPWGTAMPLVSVNTPGNEGAAAMNGDGRVFCFTACESPRHGYFGREGKGSCDLFETGWSSAESAFHLGENLGAPNTRAWESQPTLSADGRTMMFSRSITDANGNRHADLFVSTRPALDAPWGTARPVPGAVNTPGHEGNPMLHPDGRTLYFVSDGHPGMGGKDLFVSRLDPSGVWGGPVNLGYPINTNADEGHLLVTAAGKLAYFATDRETPGDLDLWELALPAAVQPTPVVALEGLVVDVVNGQPIADALVEVLDDAGRVLAQIQSPDGHFALPIPIGERWWFRASHRHYIMAIESMTMDARQPEEVVEIVLTRLAPGAQITLKNLRFESGSARLMAGFQPDLDPVLDALRDSPDLRILIVGHTDNTGDAADNLILSQNRAAAVLNHFVAAGLAPDRFETQGLGATSPIASNDTEAGRALNRRTELIVLE
jgi:outer membrane protein OmpA-like peptidoglycan-associated protein/Tfp pilus assembly protein PilF